MIDLFAKKPVRSKIEFFKVVKKNDMDKYFVVYPCHWDMDERENIIYTKTSPSFYCKSLDKININYMRGGFAIEKCNTKERVSVARVWIKTKGKLPRKIKKRLIN